MERKCVQAMESDKPGFGSQFCQLVAPQLWMSYQTSLSLNSLHYKMG